MPDTSQPIQVLLRLLYQQRTRDGAPPPALIDTEFRSYSQNGEDGILLYLFAVLGMPTRTVVEVGCGEGIECNAANLLLHHGWQGLLIDGDPAQIATGQAFYATQRTTCVSPPALVSAWVTAENIDALIASHGLRGEIDLLSIDVDGMDYWIWQAIVGIHPRVVVIEFNAPLGPSRALTLPYDPAFRLDLSRQPYKCGASLPALVALGRTKGYRLVGVTALGINAFFVRDDVGADVLPEVTAAACFADVPRLRGYPAWEASMFTDGQQWEAV